MMELFSYSFTFNELLVLALVAILIGMAKTGVHGAGMVAVPMLAILVGGKASTGLLLPMLIFADLFGVSYYHQHASWQHLTRILPFALIGVIIGTISGHLIDDVVFSQVMAVIIFASLGLMIWQQKNKQPVLPQSLWFAAIVGIIGGFATMVGNLAGPIMVLYLLIMQFPKNKFIGTAAWFFLVINLFKVPFHIFVWETISLNSFLLNLCLIPAIAIGAYLGITIIKQLPENVFRIFIISMTAVAAIVMLI